MHMRSSKPQPPQGYPAHFKGNPVIFQRIQLRIETVISTPKQCVISVPIIPYPMESNKPLEVEGLLQIELIDEGAYEAVMKGKLRLKQDFFYIYYPSEFRVDERIYRNYYKNYENLLDEVPRHIRPNIHKLLIWEEGTHEHSVEAQKIVINQALSSLAKQLIDAKISAIHSELRQFQNQKPTPKSLLHAYLLKNKLVSIFKLLGLSQPALEVLTDTWQQIMLNFRCLMKLSPSKGPVLPQKLDFPEDLPQSPYVFSNTNDILADFEHSESSAFLRIATFAFMTLFQFYLKLSLVYEGLAKLKQFLDFILSNVLVLTRKKQWSQEQMMLYDVGRNIWIIELISTCLDRIEELSKQKNIVRGTTEQQRLQVSLCSMLRNSMERIGLLVYKFDNFSIFPQSISKQLLFVAAQIRSAPPFAQRPIECEPERPETLMAKIPELSPCNNLKLRELFTPGMVAPDEVRHLVTSFEGFGQVYARILARMHQSLRFSPYPRVARSLSLTYHKCAIMFSAELFKRKYQIQSKVFGGIFESLSVTEDLYQLYFTVCYHQDQDSSQFLLHTISNPLLIQNHKEWVSLLLCINDRLGGKLSNFLVCSNKSQKAESEEIRGPHRKHFRCHIWNKSAQTLVPQASRIYLKSKDKESQIQLTDVAMNQTSHVLSGTISLPEHIVNQLLIVEVADVCLEISLDSNLITVTYQITPTTLEINSPQISEVNPSAIVYSLGWTPFAFRIDKFEGQSIHLIKVWAEVLPSSQPQPIEISPLVCIRTDRQGSKSHTVYAKIDELLSLPQVKAGDSIDLTVFLKANSNDPGNQDMDRLLVRLTLSSSQNKQFNLSREVSRLSIRPLLDVAYLSIESAQEFCIRNISHIDLLIQKQHQVYSGEEICMNSRMVSLNPLHFIQMSQDIDLSGLVDKNLLLDLNNEEKKTFKLGCVRSPVYKCFHKIKIWSEQIGQLKVKGYSEEDQNGYELVGKLDGLVTYQRQNELNLWILPVRPGNLILPEIWIDDRRGVWEESMILGIE